MKNKYKILLSFLLSIIISFSVAPLTVFAADFSTNQFWLLENSNATNYIDKSFNGGCNVYSNAKWSSISSFIIYPNYTNKIGVDPMYLDAGDNLNCSLKVDVSEIPNATYFVGYDYYSSSDSPNSEFDFIVDSRSLGNGSISFSYAVESSGYYQISITIVPNNHDTGNFGHLIISDFKIETEGESTGLLKKIVGFFQDLFDKLKNGFDNIGAWFSNLGDNIKNNLSGLGDRISNFFTSLTDSIKTFFNNLGNNLKEWFNNVGQWFKDIGDRIGSFFTDLWNNIKIKFEEFGNKISDWWQSVVDFFHSLFVPEDGYFDTYKAKWELFFSDHFGMLYQSVQLFKDLIEGYVYSNGTDTYSFTIPAIRLPFFNRPVIVPSTSFDFNDLISENYRIKYVYNTFQIMVTFISFFGLAVYARKTLQDIIGER